MKILCLTQSHRRLVYDHVSERLYKLASNDGHWVKEMAAVINDILKKGSGKKNKMASLTDSDAVAEAGTRPSLPSHLLSVVLASPLPTMYRQHETSRVMSARKSRGR